MWCKAYCRCCITATGWTTFKMAAPMKRINKFRKTLTYGLFAACLACLLTPTDVHTLNLFY